MTGTRTESGLCACTELLCIVKNMGYKKTKLKNWGMWGLRIDLNPLELRERQRQCYHTTLSMETQVFHSLLRRKLERNELVDRSGTIQSQSLFRALDQTVVYLTAFLFRL